MWRIGVAAYFQKLNGDWFFYCRLSHFWQGFDDAMLRVIHILQFVEK